MRKGIFKIVCAVHRMEIFMRILLCEDEKELSNALVKILKHYNYSVDAVYDGEEAMVFLEAENYDAVILDIMMPKLDGLSVLKRVRDGGNLVPIIMLTAKSQVDDKVTGLDFGANDYLTKPFDTKELLARLRAITRATGDSTSSVLCVGDVSLNRKTFELYTDNHSFKLAGKEFQMMEMFMMNKGQVIPTERFMEKVWGYDSNAEINVVWVYISYLRKKLKLLGTNVQIKATRNTGYSLEV